MGGANLIWVFFRKHDPPIYLSQMLQGFECKSVNVKTMNYNAATKVESSILIFNIRKYILGKSELKSLKVPSSA